jgi:hypothetical protein
VVPDNGYEEGSFITLPDWRVRGEAPIAVGQAVRLALLRAADSGRYRVELVLR